MHELLVYAYPAIDYDQFVALSSKRDDLDL